MQLRRMAIGLLNAGFVYQSVINRALFEIMEKSYFDDTLLGAKHWKQLVEKTDAVLSALYVNDWSINATLAQIQNEVTVPISYCSRNVQVGKWSVLQRQSRALAMAGEAFRWMTRDKPIELWTTCANLKWLVRNRSILTGDTSFKWPSTIDEICLISEPPHSG